LLVERPSKFGGNVEFGSFEQLEKAFAKGELHPADLKNAVARELNALVEPARKHFEKGKARECFETVKGFQATR